MQNFTRRAFIATLLTGAATVTSVSLKPTLALADPTSAEVQAEADAAREKLATWQVQLDVASNDYYGALEEHDAAVSAMDDAQGRIDAADAKISELQDHLGTRAASMYKNGQTSLVDMLLGASSWSDLVSTWDFLQDMNNADAQSVTDLQSARDEAQTARDEYASQAQIAADKLAEAESVKNEAEALVEQYNNEVSSLDAQAQQLLADEQAQAAAYAAALAQQAAADAAANTNANSGSSDSGSSDSGSDSGGSSNSGGGSSSSYTEPSFSGSTAEIICAAAESLLGVPYIWGGEWPASGGVDCSGLTMYCYGCAGISIPHYTYSQAACLNYVALSDAQAGDILYCGYHVAIYMGGGSYIHAPQPGDVVKWSSYMGYWDNALRY